MVVDVVIFSIRLSEKYSAGMGRNDPDHVRPVRQCLGRQSRSRLGSLRRYHPSGRLTVDLPHTNFPTFSVRSPFLSLALQVFFSTLDPHLDF